MAMAAWSYSQPDKQSIDMITTPLITVARRLLTRFPFSIPLPLTFPMSRSSFSSLSFPVWLHRHTPACYLMHMHQKKKTGERGPRLSQSQITWHPVTGLPTKSTHCTVGLSGRWRGRGSTAAHKELLTLPCESKVSLCGWFRGSDVAFLLQIQEVSSWSGFDCFSLMCWCVVFCKHQCMKCSYSTVGLV